MFRGHATRLVTRKLLQETRDRLAAERAEQEKRQKEEEEKRQREREDEVRREMIRIEEEQRSLERENLERERQLRLRQEEEEQREREREKLEQLEMIRLEQQRHAKEEEEREKQEQENKQRLREIEALERERQQPIPLMRQLPSEERQKMIPAAAKGSASIPTFSAKVAQDNWGGSFNAAAWITPAVEPTPPVHHTILETGVEHGEDNRDLEVYSVQEKCSYHYLEIEGIPEDLEYETDYDEGEADITIERESEQGICEKSVNFADHGGDGEDDDGERSLITGLSLSGRQLNCSAPSTAPITMVPPLSVRFELNEPLASIASSDNIHQHQKTIQHPLYRIVSAWNNWVSFISLNPLTIISISSPRSTMETLKEAQYNVEGLTSLSTISDLYGVDLQSANLNVNRLVSLEGISVFPSLRQLQVSDNLLTSLPAELSRLQSLEELTVDTNRISSLSLKHSMLRQLSASNNLITAFPMLECAQLLRLNLSNNKIEELPASAFQSTPLLIELNLGRNEIAFLDGKTISQCRFLQTLILSQNKLVSLPSPLYLPCLQVLRISKNLISDISAWDAGTSSSGKYCFRY